MGVMKYCEKIGAWLNEAKPFLLMLGLQFGSAGMYIFTMDALNKGMSHYVLIVYRNAIAAITLGPFAIFLERKIRPKMTVRIFSEIMVLAFLEVVLDQCFSLLGMKLTSASFTSAVTNSVPSLTFVLAILLRLEPMKIKEIRCQAKVIGTAATFGGALLMALYKGPAVMGSHTGRPENVNDPTGKEWVMGTFFLLIGCAAFSGFYILQAVTLRKYPAEMSLSTWICFVGTFQSIGVAAFAERHRGPHAWALGWDSRFFAPAYSGIVTSGIQYYVQGLVMKDMGPVFVTAFNPLRMIIVTGLACIILSEQLHLGSIIGGVVVAAGLYLVVWGKAKEARGLIITSPSEDRSPGNEHEQQLPVTAPTNDNKAQLVIMDNKDEDGEEAQFNRIPARQ